ncbi:hypothetical protein CKM354_001195100 [Cercospora kikuchii]|uniref:Uncharacterized protein n=1 Tax=Cercospora kikuchii TaxID=84275 RepID=A0A9P3CU05_9PEZI|nr:uncharacterized protein CKM354_001195100 [Cercospora kikuchii]GIZ48908.1 hypothetical protein CKM354_001195100 [Cercospora kikuchii]
MTNDTASTTSSGDKKRSPSTMPTSKSIAFSDTASVASAPINLPDGHPVTRANTVAGDVRPLNELHAHHIHARLASGLSQSTLLTSVDSFGERLEKQLTAESEGCFEYSNWGDEAEEAVRVGLAKLAQLARDENMANPEKSVNEYYSERLGKIIQEAEVEFDVKFFK